MPVQRRWRSARQTLRGIDRHTLLQLALLALVAPALVAVAPNPARAERPNVYAITGATVIDQPGNVLEGTTVIVRDGLIEAVGTDLTVPADAETIDGEGLTVWAGWIDAYSHLAMRQPQGGQGGGFNIAALFQQGQPEPGTGHPIELVHPQHRVTSELVAGDGEIEKRREIGFTAALTAPRNGIYRGWSTLVALRDGHPRDLVIDPVVAQHIGFDRGNFMSGYPSDLLGSVAAIRQVHYDTLRYLEWKQRYEADPAGMQRPDFNDAYEALAPLHSGAPVIVHAGDNRMTERALRLAEEFGATPIIYGSGYEYEILGMLRGTETSFILPVDYPDDPDVSNPERLPAVSLRSLQRWEQAAGNAAALEGAGITFALTPYGMGNASKFTENVRKAIEAGLTETTALAALTTVPAAMVGASATLGTVTAGKIANLVVGSGAPFAEDTEIRHVFVDGHHFEMEEKEAVGDPDAVVDPRGEWAVTANIMGNAQESTWTIEGTPGNYSGRSVGAQGTQEFDSVTLEGNALTVAITSPMGSIEVTVVIEGEELAGSASIDGPGGQTFTIGFTGERISGPEGGVR